MEFDVSKVYTAVNADKLKVGSKVICANTLEDLLRKVSTGCGEATLSYIEGGHVQHRFVVSNDNNAFNMFGLSYLVEEPEEKKLKWTDLKVGDVIRKENITYMITGIDCNGGIDNHNHVHANAIPIDDIWLETWEKVEKK